MARTINFGLVRYLEYHRAELEELGMIKNPHMQVEGNRFCVGCNKYTRMIAMSPENMLSGLPDCAELCTKCDTHHRSVYSPLKGTK